jgi:16S rRNA (uracil1498-N3)-methyltransferase
VSAGRAPAAASDAPWVFLARDQTTAGQVGVDGGEVQLDGGDDHHLRRVLRRSAGDPLALSDGAGRVWPGQLGPPGTARVTGPAELRPRPVPRLRVLQALPKARKLDAVVQAVVELGVDRVTPVAGERSVVKLQGGKAERAHDRWTAVARAAAAQSRRAWLPAVDPVRPVEEAARTTPPGGGVAAQVGAPKPLAAAVGALPDAAEEVAVAVGPEGGWTEAELSVWTAAGLTPASLGPTVLRTEHAAFAACAALAYAFGWMA